MRHLFYLCIILCLAGCRARIQYVPIENSVDSMVTEKLIPYPLPPDSASIRALAECDENGKVILRWLDIANTKNVELQFKIDSLGKIMADMKVKPDTIFTPSKEVVVEKKIEVPVEVERKLSSWEQTKMKAGGWAITFVIVFVLIAFGDKIYRLRKR